MKYLITGGCGFIGSNLIHLLLKDPSTEMIFNIDKLTYAGNRANLKDIEGDGRYFFVQGDICEPGVIHTTLDKGPDCIIHLAAETHVDNSIVSPDQFFQTNLRGTFTILEILRKFNKTVKRYVHVSTDEVYGSIADEYATEAWPLNPSSPYSAAKAGGDMLALSYFKTYGLPVVVTRASNNYGPYQFPEKLIPLMISNAMEEKPLPMYGNGMQVRDWLYVDDHCTGILAVLRGGIEGEIYNIGGTKSLPNIEVMKEILKQLEKPESFIQSVTDRLGHDVRYAIDSSKIQNLGWEPTVEFAEGITKTIDWYKKNKEWVAICKLRSNAKY